MVPPRNRLRVPPLGPVPRRRRRRREAPRGVRVARREAPPPRDARRVRGVGADERGDRTPAARRGASRVEVRQGDARESARVVAGTRRPRVGAPRRGRRHRADESKSTRKNGSIGLEVVREAARRPPRPSAPVREQDAARVARGGGSAVAFSRRRRQTRVGDRRGPRGAHAHAPRASPRARRVSFVSQKLPGDASHARRGEADGDALGPASRRGAVPKVARFLLPPIFLPPRGATDPKEGRGPSRRRGVQALARFRSEG